MLHPQRDKVKATEHLRVAYCACSLFRPFSICILQTDLNVLSPESLASIELQGT